MVNRGLWAGVVLALGAPGFVCGVSVPPYGVDGVSLAGFMRGQEDEEMAGMAAVRFAAEVMGRGGPLPSTASGGGGRRALARALAASRGDDGDAGLGEKPDTDPGTARCVAALNAIDDEYDHDDDAHCRPLLDDFKAQLVLVAEADSVVITPDPSWLDERCMNPCFPRVEQSLIGVLRGQECSEVGTDDREGKHFVGLLAQLTDSMCHEHPTKHEYCMVLIAKHAAAWQMLEDGQDGQCAESAKNPVCDAKCHTEVQTLLDLLGCCMGDVLDLVAEVSEPEDDVCLADCISGACKIKFPDACLDSYAVKQEDDANAQKEQTEKGKKKAASAWHAFFVILTLLGAAGLAFVAYKVWQARAAQGGGPITFSGMYDTLLGGGSNPADPWGGDDFEEAT